MPDTTILTTIDLLADISADVTATRGWLARVHGGYELSDRERAAIARHADRLRSNSAAALHGLELLGLHPAGDG